MKNSVQNIVKGYLKNYSDESEKLIKLCSLLKNEDDNFSKLFNRKKF